MSFTIGGGTPKDAADDCPGWADIDALRALALVPWEPTSGVPLRFGEHPLFEPWRDQIKQTAALEGAIVFGDLVDDEPVSRAGGSHAWLSGPQAPVCGLCGKTLTVCFQITAADLAPWLAIDGLLTGAYCFDCHPDAAQQFDYETFLDGALHVFTCVQTPDCVTAQRFDFVAEF